MNALGISMRNAGLFVGGVTALAVMSATVIRAPGSVAAPGVVDPQGRTRIVTHPTGGTLGRLLVDEGEHVTRGQLLMTLESGVADVGAASAEDDLASLNARRARLNAERDGDFAMAAADGAAADRERRQMELDRTTRQGEKTQIAERIRQSEKEIVGLQAQAQAAREQRRIIQPEIDGMKAMWEKRLVPLARLNQIERDGVGLESTAAALDARIASTRAQIAELRQSLLQVDDDARTKAGTELAEVEGRLGEAKTRAAASADQERRTRITAPADGVVDAIAYRTPGGVIPAGQPIMRIVPDREAVEVEAKLPVGDIDQVRPGQTVRLRFTALNAQRTPQIGGTVRMVAAERTTDERGGAWYTVRIAVRPSEIARLGLPIRAGMPVEAFMTTRDRSLLSYVTRPLRDQMDRAFREGD